MNAHSRTHPVPMPRVALEPAVEKIIAAIGFLIREAQQLNHPLTQYDIVKSLFLADRSHLNDFGRPITFDNYVAMRHGPVPSLAYDLLKVNHIAMTSYGIEKLPWKRADADYISLGCFKFFDAANIADEQLLSATDIDALKDALNVVLSLGFSQVRRLTHGDRAYKEAWHVEGEFQSNPMSLGLLYDSPNFEAAEEVAYVSQQRKLNKSMNNDFESLFSELKPR